MLRFVEIGFFLVPFALYGAWWYFGTRLSPAAVWVTIGLLVVLAGATIWLGLERSLPADVVYVPAEIRDGVIVQGHGGAERGR
jgi:hypothetical protein